MEVMLLLIEQLMIPICIFVI